LLFAFFIPTMSDANYVTDSSKDDSSLADIDLDSSFGDGGSDTSHDTDASDALVCEGMDEPNYISADHCYYPDISRWQVRWHEYPESDDEEREPLADDEEREPLVPSMDGCSSMCSKEEVPFWKRNWYGTKVNLYGDGARSEDDSDDSDESVVDTKPVKMDISLEHREWEEPSYRPPWKVAEHQRCLAALKRLEEHPLPDLYDSDDSIFDVKLPKTEK
jgi:hypothetical protein